MSRPSILPTWLKRGSTPACIAVETPGDARTAMRRAAFEMVGEFLDLHDLEIGRAHV